MSGFWTHFSSSNNCFLGNRNVCKLTTHPPTCPLSWERGRAEGGEEMEGKKLCFSNLKKHADHVGILLKC